MTRILLATVAAATLGTAAASAQEPVNVGILLGFTGPLETIMPNMATSAELAFKEATDSGLLPAPIHPVRADFTCTDAAAATAAAERLVTAEKVAAIVGADCSGVTMAVLQNVAIPNGVTMISPSSTSPALTFVDDKGLFFRTAPSDARQGEVLADIMKARGVTDIAVTYTNNDYGKGLADSFAAAFAAGGGTVAISAPHDDGKADYAAEVAALQASGAKTLAVFGYIDQGGRGIVQAALDTGAFDSFLFGDGMHGTSIIDAIGPDLDGKVVGVLPGSDSAGRAKFAELATAAGLDPTSTYTGESYDAGALIALAMGAAGSTDRAAIAGKILEVANAPGEKILPGELAKGLQILKDGGDIDYSGATDIELTGPGEAAGTYREFVIDDGKIDYVAVH